MRLRISPVAERHLEEISDYIALDDRRAADAWLESADALFRKIAGSPQMGRPEPALGEHSRCKNFGSFLVLYRVLEDEVIIVAVAHGRRKDPFKEVRMGTRRRRK